MFVKETSGHDTYHHCHLWCINWKSERTSHIYNHIINLYQDILHSKAVTLNKLQIKFFYISSSLVSEEAQKLTW